MDPRGGSRAMDLGTGGVDSSNDGDDDVKDNVLIPQKRRNLDSWRPARKLSLIPLLSPIILLCFNQGCHCVRLLDDSVIPPHALKGQKAVMRCNYDMEGDNLYSVKWYYNQKEFFRYIPSDNPKVTIFNNHPGVNVNPYLSTEREIVLDSVDFSTSGQYRCEVSGDAPMFQTDSIEGLLFVVDLPDSGPDIIGGQPRYNLEDRVNITCASRNSLPAAQLAWYINGEKADNEFIVYYPEEVNFEGLRTAKLGLSFKVRHKHFSNGDLKLKCTATISTVYWKSNEESVQGSGFNAHSAPVSESRGRTSAAASHITGPTGSSGATLLLLFRQQPAFIFGIIALLSLHTLSSKHLLRH